MWAAKSMSNILKLTLVSGVGLGGYWIGKNEDLLLKEKCIDGFSLSKYLLSHFRVLAATPLINERFTGPSDLPDVIKEANVPQAVDNVKENRISEIMKYGFPSLNNIRSYGNFVLSYDTRNRVAHWVIEHLTQDSVRKNDKVDRSKISFFEDSSIHPFFRSSNSDYAKSGFDRGHLAAAGNHKANQETCKNTFVLTNMAPQVGEGFNRDYWNNLEKYVRKLLRKYSNVYVCTGPLYLPRVESDGKSYVKYQVIGHNTVAVPTHFFKVIVMEDGKNNFEMEAYVMPNQPISDDVPLSSFQVPVESIERASGLLLFDKIPRKSFKRINGGRDLLGVWEESLHFSKEFFKGHKEKEEEEEEEEESFFNRTSWNEGKNRVGSSNHK